MVARGGVEETESVCSLGGIREEDVVSHVLKIKILFWSKIFEMKFVSGGGREVMGVFFVLL